MLVRVTILTERNSGDDPEHLCRVGVRVEMTDAVADCYAHELIGTLTKDKTIAAIEIAAAKAIKHLMEGREGHVRNA